jgi:hypothetical protein
MIRGFLSKNGERQPRALKGQQYLRNLASAVKGKIERVIHTEGLRPLGERADGGQLGNSRLEVLDKKLVRI